MTDIKTRADIELLIQSFYSVAMKDDLIGHFFTNVIKLDLEKHLPLMYDFWEMVLLDKTNYSGNPVDVHQKLHQKSAMKAEHFQRWLELFNQTVDQHFIGTVSELAKTRALSMATVLRIKTS